MADVFEDRLAQVVALRQQGLDSRRENDAPQDFMPKMQQSF
jgi:hypothetical protein